MEALKVEMPVAQKAILMAPVMKEMRDHLTNEDLFKTIETQVPNPHPTCDEKETLEQIMFGMLANVKYGQTIEDAIKLVNDGQAVDWCFDQFIKTDDFKNATENMTTITDEKVSISHNLDYENIAEVSEVIKPLIDRLNKDLKNSPVVFERMNSINIMVRKRSYAVDNHLKRCSRLAVLAFLPVTIITNVNKLLLWQFRIKQSKRLLICILKNSQINK